MKVMKLGELLAQLPAGTRVSPTPDFRGCLALGGISSAGVPYRNIPIHDGATLEEASEWFRALGWEKGRLNGQSIEVYYFDTSWWPVLTLDL